jgi:hypothetical protein
MTDQPTARLSLPLLQPGQAQKEMFHNEALARLDIAVQGRAVAAGANTPPADPAPGDCWIIGEAPEGSWAGHANQVAGWTQAGWRFVEPCEGMRLWIAADLGFALFSGGEWAVGRSYGRLFIDGVQLVGPRAVAIAEPAGGPMVDAQARAAIIAVLEALRSHGLIDTA